MSPAALRAWIERRGWSQAKAADALGVTPATVSRWLNEKRHIPTTVERLIACLDAIPKREGE